MNMNQYKEYGYADSDRLNFADRKAKQEAEAAKDQNTEKEIQLRQRLENGEITQAEYATLSMTTAAEAYAATAPGFIIPEEPAESTIAQDLTDEDYQYLNLK